MDIGTGCGTIPISLSHILKLIGGIDKLNVDVIESNKFFIDAFSQLITIQNSNNYGIPVYVGNIISDNFSDETTIEGITEKYDIITISNVLNETELSIDQLADLIEKYKNKLNETGHLIIIEPDDEIRASKLTKLKNLMVSKGTQISSPCVDFWGVVNTNCDVWCATRKIIKVPDSVEGFALISNYSSGVKFSYLIFAKSRYKYSLQSDLTKLSELNPYTTCSYNSSMIGKNKYINIFMLV